MNFKKNTHTVIKNTDIDKFLATNDAKDLKALIERLAVSRCCNSGKPDNSYYVVNLDEPYAENVLKAILEGEEGKYPFGICKECRQEFNSELINEYNITHCPWCGTKIKI